MIRILTGIFGLVTVGSVLFGYEFMRPVMETLNTMWGFLLLLIWITLLGLEDNK